MAYLNVVRQDYQAVLDYIREHPEKKLEWEVRVGWFDTSYSFYPGYQKQDRDVFARLVNALNKKVEKNRDRWSKQDLIMYIRADYTDNIRTICSPDKKIQSVMKKERVSGRLGAINYDTLRKYGIRVSLSEETAIDPQKDAHVKKIIEGPFLWVQHVKRVSFTEKVYFAHRDEIVFRYDVSGVSARGTDKLAATENAPMDYHVEIELISGWEKKFSTSEKQQEYDQFLIDSFISRTAAILGTYEKTSHRQYIPLPVVQFCPITK